MHKVELEMRRKVRNISPVGMRVLVKIDKDNMSEGGLYLPEGAKEAHQESLLGKVVEVASAIDEDDLEANISGIPLGASILFPRTAGIKVPWDDSLRLLETKEVLAIVDEVDLS